MLELHVISIDNHSVEFNFNISAYYIVSSLVVFCEALSKLSMPEALKHPAKVIS